MAPGFIDWTPYRAGVAERLAAATGKPVSIEGDLDLVLLPRPAFNADAVRIGDNGPGDFVAIDRLSARLAFLPLLVGELEFRELVLRRPAARFTRADSGAVDFLIFDRPAPAPAPAAKAPSQFDLDIDRIVIDDGVLTFAGSSGADSFALQGMDLVLRARPGAPITLKGDAVAGSTPFTIDASLARGPGTRPLTVSATLPEADGALRFSGTFTSQSQGWDLRGDLTGNSASTTTLLAAIGVIAPGTATPQAMQKPLSFSAKVRAGPGALAADPLAFDVGGTAVRGSAQWTGANDTPIEVKLEVGAVALETWRTAAILPVVPFSVIGTAFAQNAPLPPALPARGPGARFDVRIPAMTYRGQALRNVVIAASLAQSELTISDASVEMPAATRARATGRLRLNGENAFDGSLDVFTGDLRGLLTWLGSTPEGAPGRLGAASFRANVQGTAAQFTLSDVNAAVDTSTITGRLGLTHGARPMWNVDIAVSAFNFDAYRSLRLQEEQQTAQPAAAPVPAAKPNAYGVTPVFAKFAALADVDADVRLQVDALTTGGVPGGKVGLDVSLKDGTLVMRSASFENVGGATAWFGGGIGGFGVTPRFDDLQFDISAADPARVGRAFGFEVPELLRDFRPIALTGVIKGSLAQAEINATAKAENLTVQVSGQGLTLDAQPHYEFNIDAAQPSYAALVKAAGMSWPLATPDPGAVKFTAHLIHDAGTTKIEDLDLHVGDNRVAGALSIARSGDVREVTGNLTGIALAADRLWPPSRAPLPAPAAKPKAGIRAAPVPKAPPWSQEPLDWSFLTGWNGNVQIAGKALTLRGVQVQDFSATLAMQDGVLEVQGWQGKVFGAPGQLYLRVAAAPVPQVQGELAFLGGNLAGIAGAVNRGQAGLASAGRADFAGTFRAAGATPAALAASLSGSGTAKITASETGSGAISGILGAIGAVSQLEGGGRAPVTMETRFSAAEGKIKIEDATVASKSYGGAFTGVIDIGQWLVDLSGRLRLESRTGGDAGRNVTVPITVKGQLDLPNITLRPAGS